MRVCIYRCGAAFIEDLVTGDKKELIDVSSELETQSLGTWKSSSQNISWATATGLVQSAFLPVNAFRVRNDNSLLLLIKRHTVKE